MKLVFSLFQLPQEIPLDKLDPRGRQTIQLYFKATINHQLPKKAFA